MTDPVFTMWRWPLDMDIAVNSLTDFPVDQSVFADDGLPIRVRLWVEEGHLCLRIGRWKDEPLPPVRTVDPDALAASWREEEQLRNDLPEEDGE